MAGKQTGFYTMFSMIVMSLTLSVIVAIMQAICLNLAWTLVEQ